jgi:hypothetical protein
MRELLRNLTGHTIKFSFNFDISTKICEIEKGYTYFACVSANELNSPEATEYEHKVT